MKTMVSVIIPLYNCQQYVEKCLYSIIFQTYKNIELIIVDDGSTDDSAEIVKSIQKEHKSIKYFYQENSGPGVARNKAINEATGKYLLFVDADDYLSPDYIECLVKKAEEYKTELVIGGYTMTYSENGKKDRSIVPKRYEKNVSEEWAYRISACCSRLYLKEFWDKNQIQFNEERDARAEDVPIALFANAMAKNIQIVKNPGYFYYQHSGSAMNNKKRKVLFSFPYKAFKEVYERMKATQIENSKDYFYFGILKFLAQFDLVIYRKASAGEKRYFYRYIENVCGEDFQQLVKSWTRVRKNIDLPIIHKVAIELFIFKNRYMKKWRKMDG